MPEQSELPDLQAGVYRHYKGPLYLVLGYGRDSTNRRLDDRDVVVYVGLQITGGARPGARLLVRTADEFHGFVDPTTGEALADWNGSEPYPVKRFTYLGPQLSAGALADVVAG